MHSAFISTIPVLATCIIVLPCPPESRRRAPPHVLSVISSELASHPVSSTPLHRLALELQSILEVAEGNEERRSLAYRTAAATLRHHLSQHPNDDVIRSWAAIFFYEDYPVDDRGVWNTSAFRELLPPLASRHADWALRYATWMPPVVSSYYELHWLRNQSCRLLQEALAHGVRQRPGAWQSSHWESLIFPYAYHAVNNVWHLQMIASVIRQMLPPWYRIVAPHIRNVKRNAVIHKRWKVGFSYRASKTKPLELAHVFGFGKDKFEVIFFCWEGLPDAKQSREVQWKVLQRVDRFVDVQSALSSWEQSINLLMKEKLDVLVFFEIGMDPQQYLLAFSRFAPLQVALHGHAQTTGLNSIDLYVSFRACETTYAQEYYSEHLLLLDDWFYIEKGAGLPWQVLSRRRHFASWTSRLGIPSHLLSYNRYVVCKTLWKLSLDFDEVIANILELDHDGIVVVQPMENRYLGAWTDRLERRLPQNHRGRVVLLPCSLPVDAYTSLVSEATVLVDTTPWGGWQTALEAFALGVPMVTLEHSFLCVGRANAAFYLTMMESLSERTTQHLVTRLVAPSGDLRGLARRAVSLAQDKVTRASIAVLLKSLSRRLWQRQAGNEHLGKSIQEELILRQSRAVEPEESEDDTIA